MKSNIKYYLGYKFCSTNLRNYISEKKLYVIIDGSICEVVEILIGYYHDYVSCKNNLGTTFSINADVIKFISDDLNKIKKYLLLK